MTHSHQPLNSISRILNHVVAVTLSHLRTLNGNFKSMGEIKTCFSNSGGVSSRYYFLLPILWLTGCTSLKKAGLVSGASLVAASVTSAFSSGVSVPILAGASTAFATSVIVDQTLSSQTTGKGSSTLNNCAESNFWDVVGQLIEMGGWLLILVIVIPMVLGWLLPGPLEKKKKK